MVIYFGSEKTAVEEHLKHEFPAANVIYKKGLKGNWVQFLPI